MRARAPAHAPAGKLLPDPPYPPHPPQDNQRLKPEFQEAILTAGAEAARFMTEDTIATVSQAYEDMKARGLQVVEAEDRDAWAAAMLPLWEEVAAAHPDASRLIELALAAK